MATLGVIGNCFSVDGFASGSISKCARFFSKRFTPGTGGVDFFMHELSSEDFFWLFPPVNLLCKTVEHLALFRSSGVLLLPVWPKSSSWPSTSIVKESADVSASSLMLGVTPWAATWESFIVAVVWPLPPRPTPIVGVSGSRNGLCITVGGVIVA